MAGFSNCLILAACVVFFVGSWSVMIFGFIVCPKAGRQRPDIYQQTAEQEIPEIRLTRAEYLRILRESKKRTRRSARAGFSV